MMLVLISAVGPRLTFAQTFATSPAGGELNIIVLDDQGHGLSRSGLVSALAHGWLCSSV